ncbi:protein RISC-INTERACTING CLEARING 3'-5' EXORIBONUCLEASE 2-like [Vicia villosa]|uniref:protein RISC-INTERACTING CLEARING 3'-5' EXORIBONUCLEASE 2-like n=1 Tax=Vicia villosa TaxID=3911 RepID=UPI00273B736F|nr:protein RISC-INTERACTING CLEARING 3'-5' EXORIBONUCLEASE 2-like [Vicia villosa]
MGFVETFQLNGVHIETTVTSTQQDIDDILWSFLRPENHNGSKVIGFDVELSMYENKVSENETRDGSECATLHLCNGQSCLIIQLPYLDSIPTSLLNFLRLPDFTFVGVGINHNLVKLEKEYGITCRNAVELGPLAATLMKMPRLSFCGVDELAFVVNDFNLRNYRPLTTLYKDWGQSNFGKKLAKLATINVYSYYMIGNTLLD